LAQRYAAQLIALQPSMTGAADSGSPQAQVDRFHEIDLDSIELVRTDAQRPGSHGSIADFPGRSGHARFLP
jgi:hypothetical protein